MLLWDQFLWWKSMEQWTVIQIQCWGAKMFGGYCTFQPHRNQWPCDYLQLVFEQGMLNWGIPHELGWPQAFSVYPKTLNCHTFAAVLLICHVGNVEVALFFEGLVGPIFTTPCMLPLRPLYIGTSVLNTLSYALLMSMIRSVHVLDNRLSGLTVTVFENNPSWWSSMRLLGCGDGGRTAVCGEGSWLSHVRFMTGCTCHTWACLGIITGSLVLLMRRIWFPTQATSCASGQQVGGPRIF